MRIGPTYYTSVDLPSASVRRPRLWKVWQIGVMLCFSYLWWEQNRILVLLPLQCRRRSATTTTAAAARTTTQCRWRWRWGCWCSERSVSINIMFLIIKSQCLPFFDYCVSPLVFPEKNCSSTKCECCVHKSFLFDKNWISPPMTMGRFGIFTC